MSEQTSGAETVRIPVQLSNQGGSAIEGYQARHRAVPTVLPPSSRSVGRRRNRTVGAGAAHPSGAAAPVVPQQLRRVYVTPAWVPEARADEQERYLRLVEQPTSETPARPEGMIRQARWTSPRGANVAAALLLVAFLAAAVASGSGLLRRQTTPALALTLGCLLGAAGLYALLVVLRPVVVELSEPWLRVQRGALEDRFNLASPLQEMHVRGRPGTRSWRLVLGCPDGRSVRVGSRMVDSRSLDVVVGRARALAAQERAAREERFNL